VAASVRASPTAVDMDERLGEVQDPVAIESAVVVILTNPMRV
jgi:hypothetical protein